MTTRHDRFGPDYIPPAERIRRQQAAQQHGGPLVITSSGGHHSDGQPAWLVAVLAIAGLGVLGFGASKLWDSLKVNGAACLELDAAIAHYLAADPEMRGVHIERSRDTLEEAEIQARVSAEFATALEDLDLAAPQVSDLRDQWFDHAVQSEEVYRSYRCRFVANKAEICDFEHPEADDLDRERARLAQAFNRTCRGVEHGWELDSQGDGN